MARAGHALAATALAMTLALALALNDAQAAGARAPERVDGIVLLAAGSCPATPLAAPPGWRELPSECAWQGRLQLRRWVAVGAPPTGCVSAAAQWWSWERQRLAATAPVWRSEWRAAGLRADSAGARTLAALHMGEDGVWRAREWRWSGTARPATHAWETQRWDALAALAPDAPTPVPGPVDAVASAAWERQLGGRAGESGASALQWLARGRCLRLKSTLAPEPPVHLAGARADARLEQRAAMQLQLARSYPTAQWRVPFHLIDAMPADATQAFYSAVWQDQFGLAGQLWMPASGAAAPLRLRITSAAPTEADAASAAALVDAELAGLARQLALAHGQ